MPKIKHYVKPPHEKWKALKNIERGLSNRDSYCKYGVPPNIIYLGLLPLLCLLFRRAFYWHPCTCLI